MKEADGGWWAIGFVVVLCALGWLFSDHAPFQHEITVYLGWCPSALQAGECTRGEEAGNPTTYKASEETQSVVYWAREAAPKHMTGCAVRDASNWSCKLDETYTVSMIDGKISNSNQLAAAYYQVSKARWWWLWMHTKTY